MTLSQNILARTLMFVMAAFSTAFMFTSTGAFAAAPYYHAELASPAPERNPITRGIAWTCEGTDCVAPKGKSSAKYVCVWIARESGELTAFSADGEAFAAEDLAECNDKA